METNIEELLTKAHRLSQIVQKSSEYGVDYLSKEEVIEADSICAYIESYKANSISLKETSGGALMNRVTTCLGCKWLSHKLVKSGRDPIYKDDCSHASAPKPFVDLSFTGNLRVNGKGTIVPGDWCPFNKQSNEPIQNNL